MKLSCASFARFICSSPVLPCFVSSLKSYLSAELFFPSVCSHPGNCEQGGTIAEHPAHRPRMSPLCADRTRRCLFSLLSLPFPSSPSSFLRLSQEVICTAAQAHLLFICRLGFKLFFRFLPTLRNTSFGRTCPYPPLPPPCSR